MVILAGRENIDMRPETGLKMEYKLRLVYRSLQASINLINVAIPFLRETKGTVLALNYLIGKNTESFRNSYYALKCADNGYFKKLR